MDDKIVKNEAAKEFPLASIEYQRHVSRTALQNFGFRVGYEKLHHEIHIKKPLEGRINCAKVSSDGKYLISGHDDGSIVIWVLAKKNQKRLKGTFKLKKKHVNGVNDIQLSPCGEFFATMSRDHICVWSFSGFDCIRLTRVYNRSIISFCFFPEPSKRQIVFSTYKDKTIYLYDYYGSNSIEPILHDKECFSGIRDLCFDKNGKFLSFSTDRKETLLTKIIVRHWPSMLGQKEIEAGFSPKIFYSPDGEFASISFYEVQNKFRRWFRVVHLLSGRVVKTLNSNRKEVSFFMAGTFSADGNKIAAIDNGKTEIWKYRTSNTSIKFESVCKSVAYSIPCPISFFPDSKLIVTPDTKGMQIIDSETGNIVERIFRIQKKGSNSLGLSLDNTLMALASDKEIKIIDMQSLEIIKILNEHDKLVCSPRFSKNQLFLISGSDDKTVRIWNTKNWTSRMLEGHSAKILSTEFSKDGSLFCSGDVDRVLKVWDLGTHECIIAIAGQHGHFSPDNKHILATNISTSTPGTFSLNSIETGSEKLIFSGHTSGIWGSTFSHNGKFIATSSHDETIRIWIVRSGECKHVLKGHKGKIALLDYSPNGKRLASAGHGDLTVRLWDTACGVELLKLTGHRDNVKIVNFTSDGNILISMDVSGEVRFWNSRTGEHLASFINLEKGHLWTTPPDKESPSGWFYTDRPEMINVYRAGSEGEIVEVLPVGHPEREEYILSHNRDDIVLERLYDPDKYKKHMQSLSYGSKYDSALSHRNLLEGCQKS